MNSEQTTRIILGAIILAALPYIRIIICRLLGDCDQSKKSARYAIGKTVGRAVGELRRSLLKISK